MKYPNIKSAKLSHAEIASMMGYASVKSFNNTSAHKRLMKFIDELIGYLKETK